jgi:hypothetical protein
VDVPDSDRGLALVLAVVRAGVEDFLAESPLVTLDFAVVARSEGSGLLVPGPFPNDSGEVVRPVAGAVVGHDTVDMGDAATRTA